MQVEQEEIELLRLLFESCGSTLDKVVDAINQGARQVLANPATIKLRYSPEVEWWPATAEVWYQLPTSQSRSKTRAMFGAYLDEKLGSEVAVYLALRELCSE